MSIFGKTAGIIYIDNGKEERGEIWALHILVKPKFWVWGKKEDWYDGPIDHYGFGPFFLFIRL